MGIGDWEIAASAAPNPRSPVPLTEMPMATKPDLVIAVDSSTTASKPVAMTPSLYKILR